MFTRKLFTGLLLTAALSYAADKSDAINHDGSGIAIRGYDPVAYFADSKPLKGEAKYSYGWRGATWQFASEQHRDLFAQSPEKYAPQYGGYCTYGVSENHTVDIDPE